MSGDYRYIKYHRRYGELLAPSLFGKMFARKSSVRKRSRQHLAKRCLRTCAGEYTPLYSKLAIFLQFSRRKGSEYPLFSVK